MLGNLSITVGNPWWLILLPLILPPLVLVSFRSLSGLGPFRRFLAIGLRASVVTLIVLALAELQTVQRSDRLTTMFLLDVSQSVPRESQGPALQYISEASKKRRKDDLAGLIVFGKAPGVEAPPAATELNLLGIESMIDPEYTDLEAAIKLALATFPEDTARRIVLLSDGNENRGNVVEQALAAKGLGGRNRRGADRLPLRPRGPGREGVDPPRRQEGGDGQHQRRHPRQRADQRHPANLPEGRQLPRPAPGNEKPVPVDLQRGSTSLTSSSGSPSRTSTLSPPNHPRPRQRRPSRDQQRGRGFTHARGTAQVLLIEGTAGEHVELVRALRENKLEVTTLTAPSPHRRVGCRGGTRCRSTWRSSSRSTP